MLANAHYLASGYYAGFAIKTQAYTHKTIFK